MKKKSFWHSFLINSFFVIVCAMFIIPLMYVISLSFTSEAAIASDGYRLIPKSIDFAAYNRIFENPTKLLDAYKITILISLIGSACSIVVMSTIAYAISRSQFDHRKQVTFFVYFTMLFSGGLVPTYIVNTSYYHLSNNFLAYILPTLASAYHIIILRTFFKTIPPSLIESAKLDGANEFTILAKIVVPVSKPALATIILLTLLGKWNDWQTSLLYIKDERMYTLQYLLQKILKEDEFIKQMSEHASQLAMNVGENKSAPIEGMRFAMALLAAGPMLVVFPFFQKYFTRGLTVGAVKG